MAHQAIRTAVNELLTGVYLDRGAECRAEHNDRPDPDRDADPHHYQPRRRMPASKTPRARWAELAGQPQGRDKGA